MPDTITIDLVARDYTKATDPDYQKQLDRGDTDLGVHSITGAKTLLTIDKGVSHLVKTHTRAGTGRRSSCSIKDDTVNATTLVKSKNTVVLSFYGPYNDEESVERLVQIFKGMSTFLQASSEAELRTLLIGSISVPA
jgi:hypothetical protein